MLATKQSAKHKKTTTTSVRVVSSCRSISQTTTRKRVTDDELVCPPSVSLSVCLIDSIFVVIKNQQASQKQQQLRPEFIFSNRKAVLFSLFDRQMTAGSWMLIHEFLYIKYVSACVCFFQSADVFWWLKPAIPTVNINAMLTPSYFLSLTLR